jgi:DNA adenine methylase
MAYLGGKSKGAEHIIEVLNNPIFDSYDYIEPFCGYCHILRRVVNKKSYTASDNNDLLIVLLKHIQATKNQHPTITQEEYSKLRANPNSNKLRAAYAAFCYSYNGKYFGGFTESYQGRFYPAERKKYYDSLHDNDTFHRTKLSHNDYTKYMNMSGKLIYCDPPYANTTEYHSAFDSNLFWDSMRKLSKKNYVFISEYSAPSDFVCITQHKKYNSLSGRGATRKRIEKLFVHSSRMKDKQIQILSKSSKYRCTRKNN